jgi:hypothetical protein
MWQIYCYALYKYNTMSETKKTKSDKLISNYPVKKSPGKDKNANSSKDKHSKGRLNKDVPSSPTTEVNPAG